MSAIPREVVEHSFHIRANSRPVGQHLLRFDEEMRRVIGGGDAQAFGGRIHQGSVSSRVVS
jgi:hypothetical protein